SQQAAALGSLDQAQQLASAALRLDSENPQAQAVQNAVAESRQAGEAGPRDIQMINFQGGDAPRDAEPGEGDFLGAVEEMRRVQEELMRAEVQRALNQARSLVATDPTAAQSMLKPILEQVR